MNSRSFYITTLGCPKNQADSRAISDSLLADGFESASDPESAEFHIINTCAFIESAREETIDVTMNAAALKEATPGQKLIMAGCFVERYEEAVRSEIPEIDFSFGTGLYESTGSMIAKKFDLELKPNELNRPTHSMGETSQMGQAGQRFIAPYPELPFAAVKIAEGCNRSCAFCAIPQFRGKHTDRSQRDIIAECDRLATSGVREICLVSQDTVAYGDKPERLRDLILSLHEIPSLEWIRLLYLYPEKRTMQLLRLLAESEVKKFTPYLESPVQHVSARMLKAMKRAGSAESYADLFEAARDLFPDLEIRTSFLIGFPGEEPGHIDEIRQFIELTKPERLALFAYSPEEGTTGAALPGKSPGAKETAHRINLIREDHMTILKQIQLSRVGRIYRCMIDQKKDDGALARRAQDAPEVDATVFLEDAGTAVVGDILDVRITGFFEYDMSGVLV